MLVPVDRTPHDTAAKLRKCRDMDKSLVELFVVENIGQEKVDLSFIRLPEENAMLTGKMGGI